MACLGGKKVRADGECVEVDARGRICTGGSARMLSDALYQNRWVELLYEMVAPGRRAREGERGEGGATVEAGRNGNER